MTNENAPGAAATASEGNDHNNHEKAEMIENQTTGRPADARELLAAVAPRWAGETDIVMDPNGWAGVTYRDRPLIGDGRAEAVINRTDELSPVDGLHVGRVGVSIYYGADVIYVDQEPAELRNLAAVILDAADRLAALLGEVRA